MKELSIEQKAKAYDKALERVKDFIEKQNPPAFDKDLIGTIFPELRESEDEKIRKGIIKYLSWIKDRDGSYMPNNIPFDEMIAWLEKQGEQKSIDDLTQQEAMDIAVAKCFEGGEQKPTDKVEPKFKIGDFIVNDYCMGRIVEITNDAYLLDTGQGIPFSCEHNAHLWTIQDAKNGDVLASELSDSIILFKSIEDNNIQFYCDYDFSEIDVPGDRFSVNNSGQHYGSVEESEDFHPATKVQRDTLFAKMQEAGYEWLEETKELKKIEQNPAWSEEDKNFMYDTLSNLTELKDRYGEGYGNVGRCIDWLKSLKQRIGWKPSDEQMEVLLSEVTAWTKGCPKQIILESLYNDLKKLKA